jgi:Zn-dependent protease
LFTIEALMAGLAFLPIMIISLSIHEYSHAWAAWKLGDDTASREGRLTLNPMAHIDLLGTILLPLAGIPFGWAKPVPVNPARFRREVTMGRGMAITAAAGPLSNIVLALGAAVAIGLVARLAPDLLETRTAVRQLLLGGVVSGRWLPGLLQLNVSLALFNLIPLPPLDGSRIVAWLLPYDLRNRWHDLERFSPFLLLAVFWFGGRLVSGPILALTEVLLGISRAIA